MYKMYHYSVAYFKNNYVCNEHIADTLFMTMSLERSSE